MSAKYFVEAQGVWDFIQDKQPALYKLAENPTYGIEVYVSWDVPNIEISVEADGVILFVGTADSAESCEELVSRVYSEYTTNSIVNTLLTESEEDRINSEVEDELSEDDKIEEREAELDDAVYYFVSAVLGDFFDDVLDELGELCDDLKEHFLEYMARKHGLAIYRPMYLEDENGEDFFEEYPYECMEFDDEDNPVYK